MIISELLSFYYHFILLKFVIELIVSNLMEYVFYQKENKFLNIILRKI